MRPFDSNGVFRLTADEGGMRRLAVRGAGATVFSSGVALAVQMVSTVVLARILRPADFGVVAMATTFSLLLVNFGLNGFTEAVVQRDQMDHHLASNLFWINSGIGLLLTIGFAGAGKLMARFYHDPRVARVAIAISLTILLTSLSVLHGALLKRAMRFYVLSLNDIIAGAVCVAVSIGGGLAHWGYWALVAGAVARPLSACIGIWLLCRWTPALPRRVAGTGAMVRFALNIYGRFSINYCARNTDNLLVGWRFGEGALGFYKKAYDLFLLSACQLVSPLTSVAASALSRLDARSAQYKRYLLSALAITTLVGMGLGADLTLVGKDVIRMMLGPGWEPAGRIFTFFGPGVGIMLLYGTHGWIHLSIGTANRWLRWGLVEFAVTCSFFVLGLHWGPEGVAMAWTASFWVLTVPAFWYAGRPIGLNVGSVVGAVWRYILASLAAGIVTALIVQRTLPSFVIAVTTFAAFVHIVVISLIFTTLYLGSVILLYQGCAPLYQLAGLLREMAPGKRKKSLPATTTESGTPNENLTPVPEEASVSSLR